MTKKYQYAIHAYNKSFFLGKTDSIFLDVIAENVDEAYDEYDRVAPRRDVVKIFSMIEVFESSDRNKTSQTEVIK